MFIIARITSLKTIHMHSPWDGMPTWFLTLAFEIGLCSGVMPVLTFGSLLPQVRVQLNSSRARRSRSQTRTA